MHHTRTLAQFFQDEYVQNEILTMRWSDYKLRHLWGPSIARCLQLGFKLLPIGIRAQAISDSQWRKRPALDLKTALHHASKNLNLACIPEPSGIIWGNWSMEDLSPQLENLSHETLTMRTPRGYAFAIEDPGPEIRAEHLPKMASSNLDFGQGVMCQLIPVSIACVFEKVKLGCRDNTDHPRTANRQLIHDYRVCEWVDIESPVIRFGDFLNVMHTAH